MITALVIMTIGSNWPGRSGLVGGDVDHPVPSPRSRTHPGHRVRLLRARRRNGGRGRYYNIAFTGTACVAAVIYLTNWTARLVLHKQEYLLQVS
jgi:hypothetical protein